MKTDGSVMAWLSSEDGDCSGVQDQLADVQSIYSTGATFAAVEAVDRVNENCSIVQEQLDDAQSRQATNTTFAALHIESGVKGVRSKVRNQHDDDAHSIFVIDKISAVLKADGSVHDRRSRNSLAAMCSPSALRVQPLQHWKLKAVWTKIVTKSRSR